MVAMTDTTSPSAERTGVALMTVVTACPSGRWMTSSSARTVSPVRIARAVGSSSGEISRPSRRRKVITLRSSGRVCPGACSPRTIRLVSWFSDTKSPVFASNIRMPTGEVLTRASRSALTCCSSLNLRALETVNAAWDANMTRVSSSSGVNSCPPSFSVR